MTGRSKYRWPLLISVPALVLGGLPTSWRRLPASDPGDFSSESVAEIDRRRVQLFLRDGGPEFQLVALAVALVAVVTAGRDVDGDVSGTVGGGAMHGTATVPLIAGPLGGLEGEQVEDLFHGDFAAELAGAFQRLEGLAQTLVLDAQQVAESGPREHRAVSQERQQLLREAGGLAIVGFGDDFQMGRLGVSCHQFQIHGRRSGGGPVFAGQGRPGPVPAGVRRTCPGRRPDGLASVRGALGSPRNGSTG